MTTTLPAADRMRVAIGVTGNVTDEQLTLAAQMGCSGVVVPSPDFGQGLLWPVEDLVRLRERVESFGLRPRLGRFFLEMCHRTSLALFWHSPKYQKLRGRPEMSALVRRVEGLVRVAYAC